MAPLMEWSHRSCDMSNGVGSAYLSVRVGAGGSQVHETKCVATS